MSQRSKIGLKLLLASSLSFQGIGIVGFGTVAFADPPNRQSRPSTEVNPFGDVEINVPKIEKNSQTKLIEQVLIAHSFEDSAAVIRSRRSEARKIGPMQLRQNYANEYQDSFKNVARELALYILQEFGPVTNLTTPEQKNKLDKLLKFNAKMMALKPLQANIQLTHEERNLPADQMAETIVDQAIDKTPELMKQHADAVFSDILEILYPNQTISELGNKAKDLKKLTSKMVEGIYTTEQTRRSSLLARALTFGLLTKETLERRKTNGTQEMFSKEKSELYKLINEEFAQNGNEIRQVVGHEIVQRTNKGWESTLVKGMAFLLTHYLSEESFQISFFNQPGPIRHKIRALFNRLTGLPGIGSIDENLASMNKDVTLKSRVLNLVSQVLGWGVSHIGIAISSQDKIVGLGSLDVWDNYPNALADRDGNKAIAGGLMKRTLTDFVDMGRHARLVVSHINIKALYDISMLQVKTRGYQKVMSQTEQYDFVIGNDGNPKVEKSETARHWETKLTEEEFYALHSNSNYEDWFEKVKVLFVAALERMRSLGFIFHWVGDAKDRIELVFSSLCSKTLVMAFYEAVGIRLDHDTSKWHWSLRAIGKLDKLAEKFQESKIEKLKDLGSKIRKIAIVKKASELTSMYITAPSALAVQSYVKKITSFTLRFKDMNTRISSLLADAYLPFSQKRLEEVQNYTKDSKLLPISIAKTPGLVAQLSQIIIDNVEYYLGKRAIQGDKGLKIKDAADAVGENLSERIRKTFADLSLKNSGETSENPSTDKVSSATSGGAVSCKAAVGGN